MSSIFLTESVGFTLTLCFCSCDDAASSNGEYDLALELAQSEVESTYVNSLSGEAVDNAGDADHTSDTATYTAQPFAEYYVGDGLDGDADDEDELIEDSEDEDENVDTSESIEYGSHPPRRDNEDIWYAHLFLTHSGG